MSDVRGFEKKPLYLQLHDALADRIARGEWAHMAALPNEFSLSQSYKVSISTVRKAVDLLVAEGVLERRQGRGTFLAKMGGPGQNGRFNQLRKADDSVMACKPFELNFTEGQATETECERLDLAAEARVFRIERLRLAEDVPLIYEVAVVPVSVAPNLAEVDPRQRFIASVRAGQGRLVVEGEERINIVRATAEVAEALAIEEGTPLLKLDRVLKDHSGAAVEWRIAYCNIRDGYYRARFN